VLDWPLMPHAERMWKTPKKRSDYLLSCTNQDFFFFPTVAKIETAKPIEVTVGKKRGSAKS